MTTQTCEHDACLCTRPYPAQAQAESTERIDPNGAHCSRRCREEAAAGPIGDGGCQCGHPQCQKSSGAGIPPMM